MTPPLYDMCVYAAPMSVTSFEHDGSKPVQADRYKTRLCDKFCASGVCPYDTRCMFAHGEEELRTAEDNIRDGLVTEEAIRLFRAKTYSTAASRPARLLSRRYPQRYFYDAGYRMSYAMPPPPAYSEEYRHHPYVNVLLEPSLYPDDIFTEDYECEEQYFPSQEMYHAGAVGAALESLTAEVKEPPMMYTGECGMPTSIECGVVEP